jgi:hypothetical protein
MVRKCLVELNQEITNLPMLVNLGDNLHHYKVFKLTQRWTITYAHRCILGMIIMIDSLDLGIFKGVIWTDSLSTILSHKLQLLYKADLSTCHLTGLELRLRILWNLENTVWVHKLLHLQMRNLQTTETWQLLKWSQWEWRQNLIWNVQNMG